jgi:molybdopterin synthase catalytic subunit
MGTVLVDIISTPLVLSDYIDILNKTNPDGKTGAVVTFSGLTRDYFSDKQVLTLEYECYREMALRSLREIAQECIDRGALKVCLVHREGIVGISEVSVICVVMCSHRKLAFELCEYSLESIKQIVPIWKKEVYTDHSATWKENANQN